MHVHMCVGYWSCEDPNSRISVVQWLWQGGCRPIGGADGQGLAVLGARVLPKSSRTLLIPQSLAFQGEFVNLTLKSSMAILTACAWDGAGVGRRDWGL